MTARPNPAARRWLRLVPFALPIVLALTHDHSALHPRRAGLKPSFPVQTRLERGSAAEADGVVSVLASLTAWAPGEEIVWELLESDGLTRLEGPERWTGRLDRGETVTMELRFRARDGLPRQLDARARIPGRPRATAGASLRIDTGLSDEPVPARLQRDGGEILQFQGEVRSQ